MHTLVYALIVSVPLLAACPRPAALPEGCSKDVECKGPRICENRMCVYPIAPATAVDAAATAVPEPAPERTSGSPPFAMFGGNAQHQGRLGGVAPRTAPTQRWEMRADGPLAASPTRGPDGTIYVTSHDGNLYAVDPEGKVRWKFKTDDRVWSTPAVAVDGTVYIGSDDDHLYAIDGATGSLRWRFRIGLCDPQVGFGPEGVRCDADGGPTLGDDGTIYTGGDGLYAVWPDGTLRWKFTTPEHVPTSPAIASDGTLYVGCHDDALYAVSPDGTKAWEYRTAQDIEAAPAIGADGMIYFGGDDNAIYALQPDGTLRWKVLTQGEVRSSPAVAEDGTIYVGSYDGKLYAIAPNGAVKWRFSAADKIHASPGITLDGTVLFGSQDDHLYAVGADGKLLWYLSFGSDVDTTPVVSSDGVIYVSSDDRALRAFAN